MRERPALLTPVFKSAFAEQLSGFLAQKRAAGYKYNHGSKCLCKIDSFLFREKVPLGAIPRETLDSWLRKEPSECSTGHRQRVTAIRQFTRYLVRNDIPTYVPRNDYVPVADSKSFAPRIFTFAEIHNLLNQIDRLEPFRACLSPFGHLVMPELFRVLCGCGLRLSEARTLRVEDVDLAEGILYIRDTKFGKSRLVPLAPSLAQRLRRYSERIDIRPKSPYFFPAPDGGPYCSVNLYRFFREMLPKIGIVHGGRGHGPRIHDFRHTYSIHRLIMWYREGADLLTKIPILATYLGHRDISSTQQYLHLVPELFPEVTKSLEQFVGHVIPRGETL